MTPVLVFFLALFQGNAAFGAVLGVEPPDQVLLVEESSEALCTWYQDGVMGLPLVHFGIHPPLYSAAYSLDRDAASLREALKSEDCRSILPRVSGAVRRDSLWSVEDFAYAAHLLGVTGELWWIVPLREGLSEGNIGDFRDWLRDAFSFSDDFVKGLEFDGQVVRGLFRGLPVRFVTFEAMPSIDGPVLLSVEATFLHRLYVNPVRKGMVDILGRFFALLKEKELEGERVVVAVGGGTPLFFRYLGGRLRDLLAEPGRFAEGPPEEWRLQGEVEYLDYMLARDDAVAAAARLAELEPQSPLPWYDRGVIAALRRDVPEAERMLEEALRRDQAYFAGYLALAKILSGEGMKREAFALVEKGNRKNAKDYDTAVVLAESLLARGEHERTLAVIAPIEKDNPALPALHLLRARALWIAGRKNEAGQAMIRFRETAPRGGWYRAVLGEWERTTGSAAPPALPADQ